MTQRTIARVIPAIETSDGAGVKLRRSLGQRQNLRLDPFLMLDEFYSDNPDDYIAGFPAHPPGLCLKKRQSRHDERGLVSPNERGVTKNGAFSGTTPTIQIVSTGPR